MPRNFDYFNQLTGKIFAALWEKFPVPQNINFDELKLEGFDFSSEAEQVQVINSTINYLEINGFLSSNLTSHWSSDKTTFILHAQLTEKSLLALNKRIPALSKNETMGDQIIDAVKEGTPRVIASAVTNLLTLGINMITSG